MKVEMCTGNLKFLPKPARVDCYEIQKYLLAQKIKQKATG
jgi:hypothetical protein